MQLTQVHRTPTRPRLALAVVAETPLWPSGTPYHLLGRTPRHRWWHPLATLGLLAVLALLFMNLAYVAAIVFGLAAGVEVDPERYANLGFSDPWWGFVMAFVGVALMLPAARLATRWAERRDAGTLSSVQGRLRWPWLLDCTCWALLSTAVVVAAGFVSGQGLVVTSSASPQWSTLLIVLPLVVLVVPFQAAAEEYVFRGIVLQAFGSWLRTPWPGVAVSALLFVASHEYREPLAILDLLVFAVAFSWLTIKTGGLEAAIALHVTNNVVSLAYATLQGTPGLGQGGAYSVWETVPTLVSTVGYTWWITRRARQLGITATARPPRTAAGDR